LSDVRLVPTGSLQLTARDRADLDRMRNPQTVAERAAALLAIQVFREQVTARAELIEHYQRVMTEDAGLQQYSLAQLPELP
jgi:hypothetical protein